MKRKEYVKPSIQSISVSSVSMLADSDTNRISISSSKADTSKSVLAPCGNADIDEDELDF